MRRKCKDDYEEEEEGEDFEDSSDEYKPLESSDSEDSSSSDDEAKHCQANIPKVVQGRRTRYATRNQQELIFESDKYFGHTNRKVTRDVFTKCTGKIFNFCFIECNIG